MESLKNRLGHDMLVLEGAMGTMLQEAGLLGSGAPEALNLIEPDSISRIHSFYRMAGADCAITNTFGANRAKLAHYGIEDMLSEINRKSVGIARKGAAPYVLADMGPTGLTLKNSTFDEIYSIFLEQASALASGKPDGFLLETFTDIGEIRIAILACKEAAPELPIIALVSFSESGRMELSGTDPESAAIILEGLGVCAVGLNCGLGPTQMAPLALAMRTSCKLPIVVQPNAGMPALATDGSTIFPGRPEDFSTFAQSMRAAGIAAIGSCCGSDPEFTAAIAYEISGVECAQTFQASQAAQDIQATSTGLRIASPQRSLNISSLRSIGERINPTGKPALKAELQEGTMTLVRSLADEQQVAGADILDINVGVAGIDESAALQAAVTAVSETFSTPIAIDTTNPEALETALKAYPGKALVNSVTGEARSLNAVLPLVARYGAAVIVLALDDEGIPETPQGRLEIVRKVRDHARAQGIPDENLLVDSLVMAAAADKDAPQVTLETMQLVHEELGLATVLGISNVSHGLPNRALLNAAFLNAAIHYGLDAAIVNPNDKVIADVIKTANASHDCSESPELESRKHEALKTFETLLKEALKPQHVPAGADADTDCANVNTAQQLSAKERLANAIVLGDSDEAPKLVDILVAAGTEPGDIIESILTPAIQKLGEGFAQGTVFLPQLMVAADAMKAAAEQAKSYFPTQGGESDQHSSATVVFATVKGDIHSIGKDICCSLLESQGIKVVNLGVDVSTERIVAAVEEHKAGAVCLSALMTTTLPAMVESAKALQTAYPDIPVLLGGAVVTKDWAEAQNGLFEKDAPSLAARIVELLSTSALLDNSATSAGGSFKPSTGSS